MHGLYIAQKDIHLDSQLGNVNNNLQERVLHEKILTKVINLTERLVDYITRTHGGYV